MFSLNLSYLPAYVRIIYEMIFNLLKLDVIMIAFF